MGGAVSLCRLYGRRSWLRTIQTSAPKRYDCICFAARPAIYTQAAQPRPFRFLPRSFIPKRCNHVRFAVRFRRRATNHYRRVFRPSRFGRIFLFFGLKTENRARAGNGAAGNGMASRVDGRRCARRSFTLRIDARGKVFVPQDVKCRRKLRKLSRISKKPSFEGF